MHLHAGAKLPQARVWLRPAPRGLIAQLLELVEQADVGEAREAFIEKALRHRQNHAAIAIVLELVIGAIANAHRPHAAIAAKGLSRDLLFRQHRLKTKTEDGLQGSGL